MSTWIRGFAVVPEDVARELIRAIRGDVSQVALSRRLGYRSNAVAGWEGGHRVPSLAEALRAAEVRRIEVARAMAAFSPTTADHFRSAKREDRPGFDAGAPAAWLDALRGTTTARDLAARAGFSEHQLGRWLRGEAQPRLTDALVLIEAITGRVTDWVAALVPIDRVPSLAPAHAARLRVRRLVFDEPWTAAVLVSLGAGRPPASIAAALGLPDDVVSSIVDALTDAGVVAGGRVVAPLTVDTERSEQDLVRLRRHWAGVARDRLADAHPDDRFQYNVFNVSTADLARIQDLLARTFREIRSIVAASPSPDATVLYVANLCRLGQDGR